MPNNQYAQIIKAVFFSKYTPRCSSVDFSRDDIERQAALLNLPRPRNLGDVVYSFRYRANLPEEIVATAPEGYSWVIIGTGDAQYKFVLSSNTNILPNPALQAVLVPDNTPEIVTIYSMSDEQALLSKVRYNRILDLFLGVVAYSMQNHLRTKVDEIGQIEIDELYIGVNKIGQHFVIPVQAKVGNDKIGAVQLYQDIQFCASRFPSLVCVPIAVHFLEEQDEICMFRLALENFSVRIVEEKHYKLSKADQVTEEYIRRMNTEFQQMLL